jgi:NADH:ubiquinone oxidoreductase subunit F (NADH-binding)
MTMLTLDAPHQEAGARLGLPGVDAPGWPRAPRPRVLLAPGSRLLADVEPGQRHGLRRHAQLWGPTPAVSLEELTAAALRESIVGAGGAAFPTGRKLESLAGRPVSHVVVNGSEGESASGKDGVLLQHVPHLVLDGAVAAAQALRAPRVLVRVAAERGDLIDSLPRVFAERADRDVRIELSVGPATFAAGEATAVVRAVAGGPATPADLGRPPLLPGGATLVPNRRARARPAVLVSNVETFARLAIAARGLPADSALASVSGAVRTPGVVELPTSATLSELAAAGDVVGDPRVLVTGGWHGRWVGWQTAARTPLDRAAIAAAGGRWGAGAFVWIPEQMPLVTALAGVAGELAAATAGQCGPCWRGLPEVARTAVAVALGDAPFIELAGLLAAVEGRGICAHPGASAQAISSAVELIRGLR